MLKIRYERDCPWCRVTRQEMWHNWGKGQAMSLDIECICCQEGNLILQLSERLTTDYKQLCATV